MNSFSIVNLLPFWILGLPLIVAIFSYFRMPRHVDLVPRDRRAERHNIVRESHIHAGDTAASRG